MKNFIHEFKQFAVRGNVIDLAVGVIIGGAFGKIISSLVADIIMPLVGLVLGSVDFKNIVIGPVALGNFIQALVDFLIVAFFIFLAVKAINVLKRNKKQEEPVPEPTKPTRQEELLVEIRDLLKREAK